jgi:CRISPR-associated protein Cmr5
VSAENGDRQTLSQRRASFALEQVKSIRGQEYDGEVRSYAASLPAMIQMNGFGQALAFCRSKRGQGKSDRAYQALYDLVSEWLIKEGQPYAGKDDALAGVTSESMSAYRLAQTEALALLEWVKRFASAYIEKKPGNGGDDAAAAGDSPANQRREPSRP